MIRASMKWLPTHGAKTGLTGRSAPFPFHKVLCHLDDAAVEHALQAYVDAHQREAAQTPEE